MILWSVVLRLILLSCTRGTPTVDAQSAKVTIQRQENYTETRDSTREFDL
jgi:hypothetical protein